MSKLSNLLNVEEGQVFKLDINELYCKFKVEGMRLYWTDDIWKWRPVDASLIYIALMFSHPELITTGPFREKSKVIK